MSTANRYTPDYAVHPGEILAETLMARGLSREDTASRCGVSKKHLGQLLNGKASITPELAVSLERVLGVSADLWTNIQARYQSHSREQSSDVSDTQGGTASR